MRKTILGVILSCACFWGIAFGGWVILEEAEEDKSTIYFDKGRMRVESEGAVQIFDVNNEKLYFLNPGQKAYWAGPPSELKKQMIGSMKEALKGLPEEQRNALLEAMQGQNQSAGAEIGVEVRKTYDTESIASHKATRHEVLLAGELKEEIWLSTDIPIGKEIDFTKLGQMMESMADGDPTQAYEFSPQVMNLYKKGYPLRRITYDDGISHKEEVVQVEEKSLKKELFIPPADYRKVAFGEVFK